MTGALEPDPQPTRRLSRLCSLCGIVWRYLFGALACQSLPTALLVVGWTNRYIQRDACKRAWEPLTGDLPTFIRNLSPPRAAHMLPRWLCADNGRFAGGLRDNIVVGWQAMVNTWLLTLPAGALFLVAWKLGWTISFNKVYEDAGIGPLTGVGGILLFLVVMLYLPLAQARQAVTGEWRSFWDFQLLRSVIRDRSGACLLLALGYSLLGLPVAILKTVPNWRQLDLTALSDGQLVKYLHQTSFQAALIAWPIFLLLRLAAGRIYLTGLRRCVAGVPELRQRLTAIETALVGDPVAERVPRRWPPALIWPWRQALLVLTLLAWFTVVAQLYVSEFLNYHGARGWLNQPLIQLPCFRYIPSRLRGTEAEPLPPDFGRSPSSATGTTGVDAAAPAND